RKTARPARPAVEFRVRREQLLATAHAGIGAGAVLVPIFAAEGALGAFLARDVELLRRELRLPFGIGFLDFGFIGGFFIHGQHLLAWPKIASPGARSDSHAGS